MRPQKRIRGVSGPYFSQIPEVIAEVTSNRPQERETPSPAGVPALSGAGLLPALDPALPPHRPQARAHLVPDRRHAEALCFVLAAWALARGGHPPPPTRHPVGALALAAGVSVVAFLSLAPDVLLAARGPVSAALGGDELAPGRLNASLAALTERFLFLGAFRSALRRRAPAIFGGGGGDGGDCGGDGGSGEVTEAAARLTWALFCWTRSTDGGDARVADQRDQWMTLAGCAGVVASALPGTNDANAACAAFRLLADDAAEAAARGEMAAAGVTGVSGAGAGAAELRRRLADGPGGGDEAGLATLASRLMHAAAEAARRTEEGWRARGEVDERLAWASSGDDARATGDLSALTPRRGVGATGAVGGGGGAPGDLGLGGPLFLSTPSWPAAASLNPLFGGTPTPGRAATENDANTDTQGGGIRGAAWLARVVAAEPDPSVSAPDVLVAAVGPEAAQNCVSRALTLCRRGLGEEEEVSTGGSGDPSTSAAAAAAAAVAAAEDSNPTARRPLRAAQALRVWARCLRALYAVDPGAPERVARSPHALAVLTGGALEIFAGAMRLADVFWSGGDDDDDGGGRGPPGRSSLSLPARIGVSAFDIYKIIKPLQRALSSLYLPLLPDASSTAAAAAARQPLDEPPTTAAAAAAAASGPAANLGAVPDDVNRRLASVLIDCVQVRAWERGSTFYLHLCAARGAPVPPGVAGTPGPPPPAVEATGPVTPTASMATALPPCLGSQPLPGACGRCPPPHDDCPECASRRASWRVCADACRDGIKLAAERLQSLCDRLLLQPDTAPHPHSNSNPPPTALDGTPSSRRPTPHDLAPAVLDVVGRALASHTSLLYGRRLDHVVLCSLYGVARAGGAPLSFRRLVQAHSSLPGTRPGHCRSVALAVGPALEPALTQRGDVIRFYNQVFMPEMKGALLEAAAGTGPSGGDGGPGTTAQRLAPAWPVEAAEAAQRATERGAAAGIIGSVPLPSPPRSSGAAAGVLVSPLLSARPSVKSGAEGGGVRGPAGPSLGAATAGPLFSHQWGANAGAEGAAHSVGAGPGPHGGGAVIPLGRSVAAFERPGAAIAAAMQGINSADRISGHGDTPGEWRGGVPDSRGAPPAKKYRLT